MGAQGRYDVQPRVRGGAHGERRFGGGDITDQALVVENRDAVVDTVGLQELERLAYVSGGALLTGMDARLEALPSKFREVAGELLRRVSDLRASQPESRDPVGPRRNAVQKLEGVLLAAVAVRADEEGSTDPGPLTRVRDGVKYAVQDGTCGNAAVGEALRTEEDLGVHDAVRVRTVQVGGCVVVEVLPGAQYLAAA